MAKSERSRTSAPAVATHGARDDQQPLRHPRHHVLERDGGRVDVRERLVALVHGHREEGEHRHDPAGDDRRRQLRRVGDVAGEQQEHAERVEPDDRDQVPDRRAPERRALRPREARVVGGERRPGDHAREHQVDALPERREAALAVRVPEGGQVGLVDHPPGQVAERGDHEPDRELAHVAADEADRPEQREPDRDRAEQDRPEPLGAEAEHPVGERGGGARDDDQLVGRPAEALERRSAPSRGTSRAARAARASAPSPARARRCRSPLRRRAARSRRPRRSRSRGAPASARGRERAARPRRSRAARRRGSPRGGASRRARAPAGAPVPARCPSSECRCSCRPSLRRCEPDQVLRV